VGGAGYQLHDAFNLPQLCRSPARNGPFSGPPRANPGGGERAGSVHDGAAVWSSRSGRCPGMVAAGVQPRRREVDG